MKPKPKPPTHGGKRANAGRKPTGKNTVSRSVSMPARTWAALDDARGAQPRGIFIAERLDFQRPKKYSLEHDLIVDAIKSRP